MRSPQTLSEADRRIVAVWAADCAEPGLLASGLLGTIIRELQTGLADTEGNR